MLMSMAYLDQILPVSSTVEAVHVTRRAICGPGLPKTLPTDVASPCVYCFREAGSCVSVPHAHFSCTRMIHRRGFSTLVLFIDSEFIQRLKDELPTYLAAFEDIAPEINVNNWWKSHKVELPAWAAAYKLMLLVQPSSAAAECVFSFLQNSFSTKQNSSLKIIFVPR